MIGDIYTMVPHNGRQNMTWSEVGTLPDWSEFTGTIPFNSLNQGYDVTMTFVEFANGIQVSSSNAETGTTTLAAGVTANTIAITGNLIYR